jgi:hypothetical protein
MGDQRTGVGKKRSKMLSKESEMRLLARSLNRKGSEPLILELLRSDPELAKQFGRSAETARLQFDATYPGQTRERKFSNGDWENAGFEDIANFNRLIGFKRS